jgi:hypothetical protein
MMKANGWLFVGFIGIFLLVVALWSEDSPDPGNLLASLVNKVGQLEKSEAEKNAALEKRIDALERRVLALEAPLQNAGPRPRDEKAWSKLKLGMTSKEVELLLGKPDQVAVGGSFQYSRPSPWLYQFGDQVRTVYVLTDNSHPAGGVMGWTGDGIH